MRRLDLTFSALLVPLDFCALLGAAVTAYSLRLSRAFFEVRPLLQDIPFSEYLATAAGFALLWMLIFSASGLYRVRPRRAWEELGRILLACTAGMMLIIATVFFRRDLTTSRFLVLAFWGLAIFYVTIGRLVLRTIRHELLRHRIGHQRLAVIGQNPAAQSIVLPLKSAALFSSG
jgi:FlaA1/EpsC-like NDP-sugar epimerase